MKKQKMKKIITSMLMTALLILPMVIAHALPTDFSDADTGLMEGMALWAYNVTEGLFWAMLLMGFCVVLFIATSRYSTDRAFGFAGVTGIFGSIMLATLGLMTWWITTIFILTGVASIAAMIISKR